MPVLFELLREEPEPTVRAVPDHFAYIHPHIDGNGRMARFLMNALLTSGGCYPWTVVPVEQHDRSVDHSFVPIWIFMGNLMDILNPLVCLDIYGYPYGHEFQRHHPDHHP